MKTQLRIASLSLLTILCLALTASAQIYSEGPIDGNDNAFFVTGPNNPNSLGSLQDISNGFVAQTNGSTADLEWGEWILHGFTPSSFSYELGTSAFTCDNSLGVCGGTIAQTTGTGGNSTLLSTNGFGYDVYNVHVPIGAFNVTAGSTYWLTISNAMDTAGNNSSEAWDIPNTGLGGPATCDYRQFSPPSQGGCGLGGESFTLSGGTTTPEPSSMILFGSGILGVAGILRRRLMG